MALTLTTATACELDLGPRMTQSVPTFGAIVYREGCQRVSFTEDIAARRADPARALDSSGVRARAFCDPVAPASLPEGSSVTLRALYDRRGALIPAIDATLPEPLLDSFDGYLRALGPIQDDGTVSTLLARSGDLLTNLSQDEALGQALARLGVVEGVRPRATAGALPRSVAAAPGVDALLGSALPLLTPGGAARDELRALLRAGGFELRHLEKASDPDAIDRSAVVLRDLLTRSHPDLAVAAEGPLPLALRDSRGLPLLSQIAAPYAPDPQRPLARANERNRFVTASGAEIPYVPPLTPLDPAAPGAAPPGGRTESGQARRADGGLLYQYVDLAGSLGLALLRDANLLVAPDRPGRATLGEDPGRRYPMDIPFGLLRGAAPVLGSRVEVTREKEGERLGYRGFSTSDSPALELLHAGVQVLRYRGPDDVGAPGKGLRDVLRSVETLMGDTANEPKLARAAKALLDAADEARKPKYDDLRLPDQSTLFDDLAPILARIVAVPGLLEDVIEATGNEHVKNLGPMTAQLMDERGYFFMRQPTADELLTGLDPTMNGVIGSFGNPVRREQPDSDQSLDWRAAKTNDAANNRSVMQRLLQLLSDTNGRQPLCNGRNSFVFGYTFPMACDMFKVDNVALFFMLSMVSQDVRQQLYQRGAQSYIRAANFVEAIKKGSSCQRDPNGNVCQDLLQAIPDGPPAPLNNPGPGDSVLAGLMRVKRFGRYPGPVEASRLLFIDLQNANIPARNLMFNFLPNTRTIDPQDPDNRKFCAQPGPDCLFIERRNGVLFALESVRGPARFSDGSVNKHPNDSFYDALSPLVDAFAKHDECLARDNAGACTTTQSAVQILVDVMTVLHQHWPTAKSSVLGRSFAESYGPSVSPDGVARYEPLLAAVLPGDLLPSTGALAPVLLNLTVDGTAATPRALPLLLRLLRAVVDPSQTPAGVAYRGGQRAQRNDGKPAYSDATLTAVLGKDVSGTPTIIYLAADALAAANRALSGDARKDDRAALKAAVFDALDQLLQVEADGSGGWRFKNRRIRPVSLLALRFLQDRVLAHQADLPGWSQQLESDLTDALTGPLAAALMDLGVKLDKSTEARVATYTLLQQLLSPDQGSANLRAMAVAATDAVQLLLDDRDLVPIGKALAGALDPDQGPTDPALILAQRGRDLENQSSLVNPADRPVLMRVVRNLFTIPVEQPNLGGVYPMHRLSDILGEIHRESPGQGGDFSAADYRSVLRNLGQFLRDEQRGLPRFIEIVRQRSGAP